MDEWMAGWLNGWMDGWIIVWVVAWMHSGRSVARIQRTKKGMNE